MKEQDDIDHLFRSEFDDFAVTPPASVKEAVDLSIATARRKRFFRKFYIGLGAVLILFVTGIALLDSERKDEHLAKAGMTEEGSGNNNHLSSDEVTDNGSGSNSMGADSSQSMEDKVKKDIGSHSANTSKSDQNQGKTGRTKFKTGEKNKSSKYKSSNKQSAGNQSAKDRSVVKNQGAFSANAGQFNAKTVKRKSSKFKDRKPQKGKSLHAASSAAGIDPSKDPVEDGQSGLVSSSGDGQVVKQPEKQAEETKGAETPLAANKKPIAPKDSLTPYVEDSLSPFAKLEAQQQAKPKGTWMVSLKPGMTFGFNQRADTMSKTELKERSSFFIHGEASYFFTPRMAITSGLNYESRKDQLIQPFTSMDSVIVGYEYEYELDSLLMPIDSVAVPVYGPQEVTSQKTNSYKLYSIGLPIFFTYSKALSPKLNLDLSAGAIFSLQGSKVISDASNSFTVNKFGAKACVRTQLRYQFSAWGVSLNTNFGYDFVPVNSWSGIERKRTYLDLGAGVHYVIGK